MRPLKTGTARESQRSCRKVWHFQKVVYAWTDRYKYNGWDGLKTRTDKTGPEPLLSPEQKKKPYLILTIQTPGTHGDKTTLWTSQIIARLIEQIFGVKYVSGSVGKRLKQCALTLKKSRWDAWEQDKKIDEWLKVRYPAILKQAEKQDTVIFFPEESTEKYKSHRGQTWRRADSGY